jgi:malto-oligosyltrehalose trehalohydrolase
VFADRFDLLTPSTNGYWHAEVAGRADEPYRLRIDGEEMHDPASRRQLDDVEGPSLLHNPSNYIWQTQWAGRDWQDLVISEIHIGTFTPEGTFTAAKSRLAELAETGITAIEIMPVAHGPGARGWGYDGVLPFAPHPSYGTPDEFRALIDHAHGLGLCVLLDVVFNHFGPQGAAYFSHVAEFKSDRETPWGAGLAYDTHGVRDYFTECAMMWLHDYRLDGLRLDAVHQMVDTSEQHILVHLLETVRNADFAVPIHIVTEDERNNTELHDRGLANGQWNDDYHHAIHVLLTGESESYYAPFAIDPVDDLGRALSEGFVNRSQTEAQDETAATRPWNFFVNSNQTHDQIGNRAFGERLTTLAPEPSLPVAHALLLTAPFTPMLFMGEERGETAPFRFFADYGSELDQLVRDGRRRELAAFTSFAMDDLPDPINPEERDHSRLRWATDARAKTWLDLTRRLLDLRANVLQPIYASGAAGTAHAMRTGPASLSVVWPCKDGVVTSHVVLGVPAELPSAVADPLIAIGDVNEDAFAFALCVH